MWEYILNIFFLIGILRYVLLHFRMMDVKTILLSTEARGRKIPFYFEKLHTYSECLTNINDYTKALKISLNTRWFYISM